MPFEAIARVLPADPKAQPLRESIEKLHPSPITGVHLWFDREVTDLDHAVLLDRTVQWMFNKSKILGRNNEGSYLELVVSASNSLVEKSRAEIVDLALRELAEFFPRVHEAKIVKSTVIKEVNATYSPRPGADAHRPPALSVWPRVFLAGDWTSTGWPATMEGAVRSGHRAAEALAQAAGVRGVHAFVPDLPPRGLMRFFKN
jgi:zeta-carotene desaturase